MFWCLKILGNNLNHIMLIERVILDDQPDGIKTFYVQVRTRFPTLSSRDEIVKSKSQRDTILIPGGIDIYSNKIIIIINKSK